MPVDVRGSDIIGYKYFGFGGLKKAQKGLKPFEGTKKGNKTSFNLFGWTGLGIIVFGKGKRLAKSLFLPVLFRK